MLLQRGLHDTLYLVILLTEPTSTFNEECLTRSEDCWSELSAADD